MIKIKYLLVFIAILFSGCEGPRTPVGKINRSGKTYYCRGSWYSPQKYYEYNKVGLASWYGGKFHGRKKAYGEAFDKYELTAAHKTLPIPSVVRVTNLRNGKSVVVIVDDRGPFTYGGRIIDLSYGAAEALDLHRYKPSQVRIESLPKESLRLSNYIAEHRHEVKGERLVNIYQNNVTKTRYVAKFYTKEDNKPIKRPSKAKRKHNSKIEDLLNNSSSMNEDSKLTKKSTKAKRKHNSKIEDLLNNSSI